VFDLYQEHQNATLLSTTLACQKYTMGDEEMDELSVSASEGPGGRFVTIANLRHDSAVPVVLEFVGAHAKQCSGRILCADQMKAHNTFENPAVVKPEPLAGLEVQGDRIEVSLPPMSVAAITVK
jgi:alpha-L-arabinofuranosidase